jgi:phospholipid/cholesterol/gamma-HCH transport system ATP-binding protein
MDGRQDRTQDLPSAPRVRVEGLTMAFGTKLIQRDLNFEVQPCEVLVIMGGSGCGKSTLLRHLIGLQEPAAGRVLYGETDIQADPDGTWRRQFGVAFQAGALWSSMSVGENVMLPMELFGGQSPAEREQVARAKLALVGLEQQFDAEPAALSGGMRKRVAIARALAMDPPLLYLDEPSAGLDPPTSAELDELIIRLRDEHGRTVVLVSHELDSIFAVADRALFLDAERKTMAALDAPQALLESGPPQVREFLRPARARQHRQAEAP